MIKIFLKDLTFEEIMKRLQDGEAVYSIAHDTKEWYWKVVNGIVCYHGDKDKWFIGDALSTKNGELYFEEAEEFKITEKGFYRTRDGRKAYVYCIADWCAYPAQAGVDDDDNVRAYTIKGLLLKDKESPEDLVAKWED